MSMSVSSHFFGSNSLHCSLPFTQSGLSPNQPWNLYEVVMTADFVLEISFFSFTKERERKGIERKGRRFAEWQAISKMMEQ